MTGQYNLFGIQSWLAGQLDVSESFRLIGKKVVNPTDTDTEINLQKKNGEKYLVTVYNSQPHHAILERLEENSRSGIFSLPIFYKGLERDSQFFELDSRREHPCTGLQHAHHDEKARHVHLNSIEREMYETFGRLFYYNPRTQTIEEIEFLHASVPDYSHLQCRSGAEMAKMQGKARLEPLKTVKDHRIAQVFPSSGFDLEGFEFRGYKLAKPIALPTIISRVSSLLTLEAAVAETKQREPSTEDLGERIGFLLNDCNATQLKELTETFGKEALGSYAVVS